MGWTYTHRPKGQSALEFFKQEFEHPEGRSTVLDAASPDFSETYVLVRVEPDDREPYNLAVACLTKWVRDDYFNFGYKDMSEGMGPTIARCPERILERLSPIEDIFENPDSNGAQWARNWRERCWEYLNKRKAIVEAVADDGTFVELEKPIHFTNGQRLDRLFIESLRPMRIYDDKPKDYWAKRYKVTLNDLIYMGAQPVGG